MDVGSSFHGCGQQLLWIWAAAFMDVSITDLLF
jgi:hypothetical protein